MDNYPVKYHRLFLLNFTFLNKTEIHALFYFVNKPSQAHFMKEALESRIKSVAINIRRIRESKNYTQDYIAVKLAISQNAYSKIELGYTKITVERLFQIAQILEVDPIDLLSLDEDKPLHLVNSN